ncbi:MAG TPA: maltotransferase domain-containing protein, partial [Thermoanaerobaculia bacterium]|nr:maltotransferase domain-containing protein [Thermoanaerobaculia bacterium]
MADGRKRVIVEGVAPQIDCGRFAVKRVVGEPLAVEADVFTNGHDAVACRLLYRRQDDGEWREAPMRPLGNDRWRAHFVPDGLGRWEYTVEGWIDPFGSWVRDLGKKVDAGQQVGVDLLAGARWVNAAAERATGADAAALRGLAADIGGDGDLDERVAAARDPALASLMARYPDRTFATRYPRVLPAVVDPPLARFGAWYELFPRSASPDPQRHGTFRDVEARLP